MTRNHPAARPRVALVSTPWPLYSHPSIQLGVLKAYLGQTIPDLRVDAHHFFLQAAKSIGYRTYQAISERIWTAECFYSALLFPDRRDAVESLYLRETAGRAELRGSDFGRIVSTLGEVSEEFIHNTDWGAYGLTGFSICLCQLTSSLYFIRRIKERHPEVPMVVGGSGLGGNPGDGFFKAFPEVDFLIVGEGEQPLAKLVQALGNNPPAGVPPAIPGVITRESAQGQGSPGLSQLEHLNGLPPPNYDDYFQLLAALGEAGMFFPTLPAEMSRGCWWRRSTGTGSGKGCTFCNLNLQWQGYRAKDPDQITAEIDFLTDRHKTLSIAFTDNVLPVEGAREILEGLAGLDRDLRLFGEIRASTSAPTLRLMKTAGFSEVQVGIEALGTRLLRKMNKGSSAIENLEIMKNCEEAGLANVSNLILEFPGSDEEDVEETLRSLEFARAFRPLRGVVFWLGMGSPIFESPRRFGLKATFNHPKHAALFPPDMARSMRFMIQGYRGDTLRQKRLWKPVRKKLTEWRETYAGMGDHEPLLAFRDGGSFLLIHQRIPGTPACWHRLVGTSREIYLFCRNTRSMGDVMKRFPGMSQDQVLRFLRMMVDKKLMFEEGDRVLSLAVSNRARGHWTGALA